MHYLRVYIAQNVDIHVGPSRHALDETNLVRLRRLDGKIVNTRQLADTARLVDQLESVGGAASPMPVEQS